MPPGGDGLYYFYAHVRVTVSKFARFEIRRNGAVFCQVWEDERDGNDSPASSCGAVVTLLEGTTVLHYFVLNLLRAYEPLLPLFKTCKQSEFVHTVAAMTEFSSF